MATIINLPQDKSFHGGAAGSQIGSSIADFLNARMEEEKKKKEQETKMKAFQAAFEPEASDSEVASNLFGAGVEADVVATIMQKREEAKEKELTYQKVTAYNNQGQEVTKFVPKNDLGNIEQIMAKQGLSLVKPVDADTQDPTENETAASDLIASMGGNPEDPAARTAALDLTKHRGEITEDINNHFGTKFGEDFKFDTREDKLRAQLADTMVPRIMLLEGKERGQAIKEGIAFANEMIPQEEDVLAKDTKQKPGEETEKEGSEEGEMSLVQKLMGDKKKQQEKEDNRVTVGRFAGQEIKISKDAEAKAKSGSYELAIQEVMANNNLSRKLAIEALSQ